MPDIIVESPTGLKKLVFHNQDKNMWFIVPAGTILSEGSLEVHCSSTIPRRFQVEPMSISL